MTNSLLAALILASLLHAAWNLGSRRWRDTSGFLPAITLWGFLWMLCLLPFSWSHLEWRLSTIGLALVSGIGLAAYLIFVRKAYHRGDISLVYPLMRSAPLWVTLVGFLLLGERLSSLAVAGVLLTICGVAVLPLSKLSAADALHAWFVKRDPMVKFALAASFATCVYTISDRVAMNAATGILAGAALIAASYPVGLLLWWILVPDDFAGIDWRGLTVPGLPWYRAAAFGFCIAGAYAIIIGALIFGEAGRVLAVTNLSVILGSIGGMFLFREHSAALPRVAGLCLTVAGIVLLRLY